MPQQFILGYYYQVPEYSPDYILLGWQETTATREEIYSYRKSNPDETWVLIYRKLKIAPLHKMWIPYIYLKQDDIPAKYPRPNLPDQYEGRRVIQLLRKENNKVVAAINSDNPEQRPMDKFTHTGWSYSE